MRRNQPDNHSQASYECRWAFCCQSALEINWIAGYSGWLRKKSWCTEAHVTIHIGNSSWPIISSPDANDVLLSWGENLPAVISYILWKPTVFYLLSTKQQTYLETNWCKWVKHLAFKEHDLSFYTCKKQIYGLKGEWVLDLIKFPLGIAQYFHLFGAI